MTANDTDTIAGDRTDDSTTIEGTAVRVLYAGTPPAPGPTPEDLTAEGFEVVREPDFADAIERVEDGAADCVVAADPADGFDGVAFLEAVRREYAELPVVLVPEASDAATARRAVDADATALVPARDDDALDAVVDAIEHHAVTDPDDGGVRMPISDLSVEDERRLKERALDEAPIGITISDATDPENPIIYANESFHDLTGYPPEETMGVNHRFLQGPDTDPDKIAELGEGIAEKRDVRVVLRNYTRDGTMFWNQVDVSPIVGEDGEVTHYVGFQMDVTERRRAQRRLEQEREALDRLLDRVNGLVNDVTEGLVQADSRAGIEEFVIDRLEDGDEYAAAWLGRYDAADDRLTVADRSGEDDPTEVPIDLDDDEPGVAALRETIADQEARVIDDPAGLPTPDGGGRCVLVPLTYRSTTYGVLAAFDDEEFLDDRERVLLGSLGRSVGTSINDVLTKRTMTTDAVLNIAVEIHDDHPLVELARDLDCEFDHEATISDDDGPGVVVIVSTDRQDGERIVERAATHEGVLDAETLVADDDGCVVQFRIADATLVDILSEAGGRVTDMHADGAALRVEFRVGTERTARRVLDELRETYDRIELRAYHETDEPAQTARGFREDLRGRLTDRQLTALRKAYVSGFFDWPRRVDGEQLADSMDIVPSTYHQHLQAAKRKLVGAFFEE